LVEWSIDHQKDKISEMFSNWYFQSPFESDYDCESISHSVVLEVDLEIVSWIPTLEYKVYGVITTFLWWLVDRDSIVDLLTFHPIQVF